MIRKLALAAGLALVMTAAAPPHASAVTVGPNTPLAEQGGASAVPVQWGYCRAWARTCAARWGWGTWRFRRCMRLHGC